MGRFLQGAGVAGPKFGTRAMIRDLYSGTDMAQGMSVIFILLTLVPKFAPAIGAVIVTVTDWRGVFLAYLTLVVGLGVWLCIRHPETLPVERRMPLQFRRLTTNRGAVSSRADVTPVIVATGFIFGAQLTYFAVAADLFVTVYGLSETMPVFFALLATGTGAALLLNVPFIGRTGLEIPILADLMLLGVSGGALLIAAAHGNHNTPLGVFLSLGWLGFFALGLLFGNLNALAMRPLGDLTSLSSSIIALISRIVEFIVASVVEAMAAGPVWAVAWAFALVALLAGVLIFRAIPVRSFMPLVRLPG